MKLRSAGFTLIEILIAVAVMGMVLILLRQGIRAIIQGTSIFHRVVLTQSNMEPVERALRRMIERMDPGIYPEPPRVLGSPRSLAFTTELPDPATGGTLTADVRLEAVDGRLILWWMPHTLAVPFGAPPHPDRIVLIDHVARLDIGYATKGPVTAWLSTWDQPALPGLVRIRLVQADGDRAWPAIIVGPRREQAGQ